MLVKSSLNRNTVLLLFVFSVLLGAASAQKESVLYSFCTQNELHRRSESLGRTGL